VGGRRLFTIEQRRLRERRPTTGDVRLRSRLRYVECGRRSVWRRQIVDSRRWIASSGARSQARAGRPLTKRARPTSGPATKPASPAAGAEWRATGGDRRRATTQRVSSRIRRPPPAHRMAGGPGGWLPFAPDRPIAHPILPLACPRPGPAAGISRLALRRMRCRGSLCLWHGDGPLVRLPPRPDARSSATAARDGPGGTTAVLFCTAARRLPRVGFPHGKAFAPAAAGRFTSPGAPTRPSLPDAVAGRT